VFDEMFARDLITWNVMITGYAENGHARSVLEVYSEMKLSGASADVVTLLGFCWLVQILEHKELVVR